MQKPAIAGFFHFNKLSFFFIFILTKPKTLVYGVRVVFTDSGQLILWQDQIKHVKKYKLNNNYIELNLSDTSTHGATMYCYYKLITADNSVNLIGIDKKDFVKSNNK